MTTKPAPDGTHLCASVVVCVYNRPADVQRCFESLMAQTRLDFEIVFVDDASTDSTPAVLRALQEEHPAHSVHIVRNALNAGVSGARNTGIEAASTTRVLFLDSDCIAAPTWVDGLCSGLQGEVSAVSGAVLEPPAKSWADRAFFGGLRVGIPGQGRYLAGCNMGFARSVVLAEPFDPAMRYTGDEDDMARRLKALGHSFAFCPDAVVVHHHHVTTASYLRTAWRHGAGSARFWYKHDIGIGRDVVILLLAILSLPLAWMSGGVVVPAVFLLMQIAALLFSEVRFKGNSLLTGLSVLPLTLTYSLIKLASVLRQYVLILSGRDPVTSRGKQHWERRRRQAR